MNISYRTRKGLRRFAVAFAILAAAAVIIYAGWVIWAGRYIIYTREGAKLDTSMNAQLPEGVPAVEPTEGETVPIIYREPVQEEPDSSITVVEPTGINGYYIELEDLKTNIASLQAQLEKLSVGTAVMLDMKNIRGDFYYQTAVGSSTSDDIDMEQMDALLEYLHSNNFYVIARIPAFRDREYGLNNVPHGLAKKGGKGSLWMDDQGCYWLDPTSEGALGYLVRIVMELKSMGFDEVVFTEFRFPDTDKLVFDGDRAQALEDAAKKLVETCATNRFFVSFYSADYSFPLPTGNSRLYLEGVAAADIPNVVNQAVTTEPEVQLMFITEVSDTRFNDYCVLRPLDSAH